MTNTTLPPLRPELVVCPNPLCGASGRIGIHSYTKRRYKCHACGKTFAETIGTPLYGLKSPLWVVRIVLILLAFGCPVPAIVAAFGVDERTVTDWHQKAGRHAKVIQDQVVCQGQVEVGQVQGDELYVKTQHGTVWMATAMSVFSRLFLWGAVAPHRDTRLITQVVQQVRAAAQRGRPILWAVDGFAAWTTAILTVFREPLHTGKRGRPRLVGWPDLHIVQVIKRRTGRRLTALCRGQHAGDPSRPGGDQHRLHRALECDVPHLAARLDAAYPHPSPPSGAPGSRHVLAGGGLQLLPRTYDPQRHPGHGSGSDRSCLVGGRITPLSAEA